MVRELVKCGFTFLFTFEIVKCVRVTWRRKPGQIPTSLLVQFHHSEERMLFFSSQNQELFCWTTRSCFTGSSFPPTVSSQETVGWECFTRPLLSCIFSFDIWIHGTESTVTIVYSVPSGFPFFFTRNLWKLQHVLKNVFSIHLVLWFDGPRFVLLSLYRFI